jgi:hypothetical protein
MEKARKSVCDVFCPKQISQYNRECVHNRVQHEEAVFTGMCQYVL